MDSGDFTSAMNRRMQFAGAPNLFDSIYRGGNADNRYSVLQGRRIGAQSIVVRGAEVLPAVLPVEVPNTVILPSVLNMLLECLEDMLRYVARVNLGPTRSSRIMYIWFLSICSGWNWIGAERGGRKITGVHDNWNWDMGYYVANTCEWMATIFDHIMPIFISGWMPRYVAKFDEEVINTIKVAGRWSLWLSTWSLWYSGRATDGSIAAAIPPTDAALPNGAHSIDVLTAADDPNGFPAEEKWTPLIVQGKRQKYMTYNWGDVVSTCISVAELDAIAAASAEFFPSATERSAELDEVISITAGLTDEQKVGAEFWAGGPGTVSPPCMFLWFWKEFIRTRDSLELNAIFYSGLDLAIHLFEGGRVTWYLKKKYMQDRPIQEVRRTKRGVMLGSWVGGGAEVSGELWTPYQESNFVTPPFADFPSGHSHFSKAFALVMSAWFGEELPYTDTYVCSDLSLISPLFTGDQTNRFGVFTVNAGTSGIQSGIVPSRNITLSWRTWDDMANAVGMSRIYGGIHCISAHRASQAAAVSVDQIIRNTWGIRD